MRSSVALAGAVKCQPRNAITFFENDFVGYHIRVRKFD
jgi:hypothetical protein